MARRQRYRNRRRLSGWSLAALLASAAFLAPGCGDSGDSPDSAADGDAAQIERTYRGLITAFEEGDASAICSAMTDASRRAVLALQRGARTCEATFGELIRVDRTGDKPSPMPTRFDVRVTGNRAMARIAFGEGESTTVPFAREDGGWKLDGQVDLLR